MVRCIRRVVAAADRDTELHLRGQQDNPAGRKGLTHWLVFMKPLDDLKLAA
jgi:hypothetical protein